MPNYQYSVVKFLPDLIRKEPVNIGILVREKDTGMIHGKFSKSVSLIKKRHPNLDTGMLEHIMKSYNKSAASEADLAQLAESSKYNLQFTVPTVTRAQSPAAAIQSLFDTYVQIKRLPTLSPKFTKKSFNSSVMSHITSLKFASESYKVDKRIKGSRGQLKVDFMFQNGKMSDLMHTIPFGNNIPDNYKEAVSFSTLFKDVVHIHNGLECAVFIPEIADDAPYIEEYDSARRFLLDSGCKIKRPVDMPVYLSAIKEKISPKVA